MTFQAVIILTCDFWFVFGSFLAGEQALQLWRGNRPWRERVSEGGGPSHWRACSQTIFFFVTMLLYFLGPEVFFVFSRAWSVGEMKRKKNEPQSVKTWVQFVNEEKPLRAGSQGFIDRPVFFSLYEMPMSSTDHKNAYIFQRKIQLVAMSKSWKIQFCELLAIE